MFGGWTLINYVASHAVKLDAQAAGTAVAAVVGALGAGVTGGQALFNLPIVHGAVLGLGIKRETGANGECRNRQNHLADNFGEIHFSSSLVSVCCRLRAGPACPRRLAL